MVEVKSCGMVTATGVNNLWKEKKCFCCGEYFKDNENLVIVIPTTEERKKYSKRMSSNQVVHYTEMEELCNKAGSREEVIEMLENYKIKKEKPLTDEEKQRIDTFIKAASSLGFSDCKKSKNGCTCKRRGSSDTFSYNVKSDRISYDNRRRKGLFDGFFEREIVAKVYNKFHELLGDNKKDDFSATETISEAIEKAKDILK